MFFQFLPSASALILISAFFTVEARQPIPSPDAPQSPITDSESFQSTLPAVIFGSADAPLKIVMFHSLNCIHCKKFKDEVLPEIETRFIQKGFIQFTMVDFPTDPSALDAAKIAWEARNVEAYQKVSHILVSNYETWAGQADWQDQICKVATNHHLMTQAQCLSGLNDEPLGKEILRTAFEAQKKYHIDYAPAFLFNGKVKETTGLLSIADIENELKALKINFRVETKAATRGSN